MLLVQDDHRLFHDDRKESAFAIEGLRIKAIAGLPGTDTIGIISNIAYVPYSALSSRQQNSSR